jgi:hypothetical protein
MIDKCPFCSVELGIETIAYNFGTIESPRVVDGIKIHKCYNCEDCFLSHEEDMRINKILETKAEGGE